MTTKELLRDKLAPAIGRVILKYALGADASTIGGPFLDWLSAKFKDRAQAAQAERFAREVANRVVDGLVPVFERDRSPDLNPEAVVLALGDTLDRHFDGKFLVGHDLDSKRLIEAAFELRPLRDLKAERYSTVDIELYERALPQLVQSLVPRAKEFSDFEVANAAEVLARLRQLSETQDATHAEALGAHAGVRRVETWLAGLSHAQDEKDRAFTIGYLRHIEDNLDDVQLVGITADPAARRQRLSKAYIPLSLSGEPTDRVVGGPVYFETLLDTLTPTHNRLLVIGAAGSGKTTLLRWAAIRAALTLRRLIEFYAEAPVSLAKPQGWQKEFARGQRDPGVELPAEDARRVAIKRRSLMRQLDPAERSYDFFIVSLLRMGELAQTEMESAISGISWSLRIPFLIPLRLGPGGGLPDLKEFPGWRPTIRCRRQRVGLRAY